MISNSVFTELPSCFYSAPSYLFSFCLIFLILMPLHRKVQTPLKLDPDKNYCLHPQLSVAQPLSLTNKTSLAIDRYNIENRNGSKHKDQMIIQCLVPVDTCITQLLHLRLRKHLKIGAHKITRAKGTGKQCVS